MDDLAALAAASGAAELRPAPGRALIAVGLSETGALREWRRGWASWSIPATHGLPIVACSGAPACASAHLATRALAAEIAGRRPDLLAGGVRLHLSGCGKRCAQPAGAAVSLVAGVGGNVVTAEGMAVPEALRAYLEAVG